MSNKMISTRGLAFIIIVLAVAAIVLATVLTFILLQYAIGPFLAGTIDAILITVIAVVGSKLVHNRFVKVR